MSYYTTNLNLLKEKEPALAKRLEEIPPSPNIVQPKVDLDSFKDLDSNDIIAILGFGIGTHIKEILKRSNGTFVLVIDHDMPSFKKALSLLDLTQIFREDRVNIAIGEKPSFAAVIRIHHYFGELKGNWKIQIISHTDFIKRDRDYYKEVERNLKDAVLFAHGNFTNSFAIAPISQSHILKNLSALVKYPRVTELRDRFRDIPAIIVSPGPSLNKNVLELKRAKGRALIICVDTALKVLLKNGIRPDLIVAVDFSKDNYDFFFKGLYLNGMSLAADMHVYPDTISNFPGYLFIYNYGNQTVKWLGKLVNFQSFTSGGGSATHIAFSMAGIFGNNPVIFVGLDLSFPDRHTYEASGVDERQLQRGREKLDRLKGELFPVEDIYGGKVLTSELFFRFLRWLEITIKIASTKYRFIDATEGGAKIEGTEVMTLQEAINTYCKEPIKVSKILREAKKSYKPPNKNRLILELEKGMKEWEEIEKIGKEGETNAKGLIDSSKEEEVEHIEKGFSDLWKLYQSMANMERFVMLDYDNISDLFARMDISLSKLKEDDEDVNSKLGYIYQRLFEEISKICNRGIPTLKESLAKLRNL